MSNKFDWNDFSQVSESPSFAWDEYSKVEGETKAPKRGLYEEFVERPGQIAGQAAVAGARALPRTAFDLLKTVVSATGGDISKLEKAQKESPEWLRSVASKAFPTYEEVRKGQEGQKTFTEDKLLAQPETSVERGIEKFGRFIGEAPAFGGVGGARGLASLGGLATGVQLAEESELGPVGQILSGVAGAFIPGAALGSLKGVAKAITASKKAIAKGIVKGVSLFTPKDTLALQKQIINDAREAGVQLDIGSLTNSKTVKFIQSQLAQSPLTGSALEQLKTRLSEQVATGYKTIVEDLGKAQFETVHDAGQAVQDRLRIERDASKAQYSNIYNDATKSLTDKSTVYPDRVISMINKLETQLKPGSIKGTEQKAVLQFIEDLKKDVMHPTGELKSAKVKDLINDKIAIHDIVDYEIEGGTKQLLKQLAKEIDTTIQQYGREDAQFAKNYKLADKKFGEHARTFRNKNIASSLKTQDPRQILTKMNTTQGIRDIKKSLDSSVEGKEIFKDLSRFKLDQILEKNLEYGLNHNIKFGQFATSLKKANNREIVKELLGKEAFNRLDKLMKTSGTLAESASKFLNTSQSQVAFVNLAFAANLMADVGQALSGNVLPLIKTGGTLVGVRQISKLISDPKFLKLVEEAILASNTNNPHIMERAASRLKEGAKVALRIASDLPSDLSVPADDNVSN